MLYDFYNYYSNTINPKTISRYDTHKKNELKKLCNSIIKLNRNSPLYLIDMTDDLQNNVIKLKEHARYLKNTILSISENEDPETLKMFNDKILTSSNEDIVTARYNGTKDSIDDAPSFELQIEQLATPQINKGHYIYSNTSSLESGDYSFYVTISNTNYEFQFEAKDTDKNKDLLKKIANMINRADIGIYSTIEPNESGDMQRILLTSLATGTVNFTDFIFKINDNNNVNSLSPVKYLGLDQVVQKANNCKFSINDIPRSSTSNIFTVNKVYELSLHNVTAPNESITVSFKNDIQSTLHKINNFVKAYNDLIFVAKETRSVPEKNVKLLSDIGSVAKCYKNELDSMGLMVQDDSSICIDNCLVTQVINEEEDTSGSYASLRSFRNPLSRKIDYLLLNPMEYVSKTIVTYPNTKPNSAPTNDVSIYSGMMFNNYC